ncbi:hypothetical protein DX908_00200 [Parvularcula marina]|uniref:Uncharacterized protein n=1 Tax=Parvularcula marina TaxID=2292771 RepID=A0A371REH1_9PROT|nr:hypothetical protein DX908_00200 [Parvularcula marina]
MNKNARKYPLQFHPYIYFTIIQAIAMKNTYRIVEKSNTSASMLFLFLLFLTTVKLFLFNLLPNLISNFASYLRRSA